MKRYVQFSPKYCSAVTALKRTIEMKRNGAAIACFDRHIAETTDSRFNTVWFYNFTNAFACLSSTDKHNREELLKKLEAAKLKVAAATGKNAIAKQRTCAAKSLDDIKKQAIEFAMASNPPTKKYAMEKRSRKGFSLFKLLNKIGKAKSIDSTIKLMKQVKDLAMDKDLF